MAMLDISLQVHISRTCKACAYKMPFSKITSRSYIEIAWLYRSLSKIRPWAMNLAAAQRGGWAYFRGPLSRK